MPALPELILLMGIVLLFVVDHSRLVEYRTYPAVRATLSLTLLVGVIGALLCDTTRGLNLFKQGLGLDISLHVTALGRLFCSDVCSKLLKLTLCVWALLYGFEALPNLFQERSQQTVGGKDLPFFFALLGGLLTLSAQDFRLLFLGTEIVSLALLILLRIFERPSAGDLVFRVFILNSVGAALILFGASLLGGLYGTTDFAVLTKYFRVVRPSFYQPFLFLAFALVTFGYFAKMRLFPFQGLTMDVAEGAERPLFPLLGFLPRFAFLAALLKLFIVLNADAFRGIFLLFGSVGALFATLAVSRQNRIQPLLSCLALAQSGLLMVGFSVSGTSILPSLLFEMFLHSLAILVFVGTLLWLQRRDLTIMTLGDLAFARQKSSVAALLLGLSALSLVGFPLTPGFAPFLVFVQNFALEEAFGAMAFVTLTKCTLFWGGITIARALVAPYGDGKGEQPTVKKPSSWPWKEGALFGVMIALAIKADDVLTYFSLAETTLEWYGQEAQ